MLNATACQNTFFCRIKQSTDILRVGKHQPLDFIFITHTNHCPTGVATQDPERARVLVVEDKSIRVRNFQQATVASAAQLVASMGIDRFDELTPRMLNRRIEGGRTATYAELYEWLSDGELLNHPRQSWRADWDRALADAFA